MCIRWLINWSDSTKMHGATIRFMVSGSLREYLSAFYTADSDTFSPKYDNRLFRFHNNGYTQAREVFWSVSISFLLVSGLSRRWPSKSPRDRGSGVPYPSIKCVFGIWFWWLGRFLSIVIRRSRQSIAAGDVVRPEDLPVLTMTFHRYCCCRVLDLARVSQWRVS